MSPKVVDKEEKKGHILEAAMMVFARKGFAKTTISDIAAAAGIGKGTIYEYFSRKEDIVDETFVVFMTSHEEGFRQMLKLDLSGRDKMTRLLMGFVDFMDQTTPEMLELMFNFWAEAIRSKEHDSMIYGHMKRFYSNYREIFTDVILQGMQDGSFRKNINPAGVSSMLIGALDGVLVQWILDKEAVDFESLVKTLINTLLNGIDTAPVKQ